MELCYIKDYAMLPREGMKPKDAVDCKRLGYRIGRVCASVRFKSTECSVDDVCLTSNKCFCMRVFHLIKVHCILGIVYFGFGFVLFTKPAVVSFQQLQGTKKTNTGFWVCRRVNTGIFFYHHYCPIAT
ncbi:hypothetical protein AKJ16_DCAP10571 [Drosera capensis]